MTITKESLDQNITSLQNEQEQHKAGVYRTEGAIQAFKFLQAQLDAPEDVKKVDETPKEG